MSGLACPVCGQLNHVGLRHTCDHPDMSELVRRMARVRHAEARAEASSFNAAFVASWANAHTYIVVPEPPRDTSPIRVQAYVGHRLAEIETRGTETIEGELA